MPGTDPTHIAGYRIVRTIGRGGMSTVYLAQHLHLNRQVALKVLDPELADAGTFRERFARESQIVAELEHPHIVPVYDAGEADGLLYMVMRYVENRDLRSLLPPGATLPHQRVRTLVEQVAGALEVAHDAGLVHRDIKPANVLASTDRLGRDHFYLSDFGITKRTDGPPLTATGQVLGSADFIAPEQISGRPLDRRTDVYALGVLVYRCLTGHLPFERDHEVAVLLAHAREVPQPASSVRPELTPAIDAVLARVLSKDPADRPATAQEFSDELKVALDAPAPVPAPPADTPTRATTPPSEVTSSEVAPTDPTTVSPPPTDPPETGSSRSGETAAVPPPAPEPAADEPLDRESPIASAPAGAGAAPDTPSDEAPADAIPTDGDTATGPEAAGAAAGPVAEDTTTEEAAPLEEPPAGPQPTGSTSAEQTTAVPSEVTEAPPARPSGQEQVVVTAVHPGTPGSTDAGGTGRPSPRPRTTPAAAPEPAGRKPAAEPATTRHDTGTEPPTAPTGQPGQTGRPRTLVIGSPGQPVPIPVPEASPDAPTTRTPAPDPPTRPVARDRRAERRWAILLGLLSLLLILATVAVALLGAR